ncbi:MAG: glycosyltransferase [Candidatus Moraniibacteriota bacterium]|jgi:1,2-diacylglycerol 3-alpha-glucosyltransferase
MKIAIFTNNYLPNPYGVSTSVEGFRRSLIALGHTVYVFAPEWGDNSNDEVNIFRYPSVKAPTKIDFSIVIPYSHKMDDVIKSLDIDIIHAQHPNLLGSVASKWAIKKDVPLIFTWHSLYDRYAHYTPLIPEKLSGHWAMKEAAGFAEDCDHVIVPTKSIIDVIKIAGVEHERVSIVPSGVDEDLFVNPMGNKIKNQYDISEDKTVLVTVSRLNEEKNVIFLANCIAEVLSEKSDVVFLCGGEGELQKEMEDIFKLKNVLGQVIFPGKIKREDVKNYLDAGDFFVYASTSETQGTIVTENMYVGKPIVAIGENGVGDLIEDSVNGISVIEDEREFINAVISLIDDKEKIKLMSKAARQIAQEKYTTTACAKNLVQVYEDTIEYYDKK